MGTHQLSAPEAGWVDKRADARNNGKSRQAMGGTLYTCNGAGTTTTLVGAAPVLNTGVNVVKAGQRFQLRTAAGALKENTTFTVTAVNAAGTTVTFSPAAAVATASGDVAVLVSIDAMGSNDSLDARLLAIGAPYTQSYIDHMTQNDKLYAIRQADDPTSVL